MKTTGGWEGLDARSRQETEIGFSVTQTRASSKKLRPANNANNAFDKTLHERFAKHHLAETATKRIIEEKIHTRIIDQNGQFLRY